MNALQVLFIQGAGEGVHDHWDQALAGSLRVELGNRYEVRYPRMPDEDDPSYERWSAAIRRELAELNTRASVVGHSIGGSILMNTIAEYPQVHPIATVALIAAPFVGKGGWSSEEWELPSDLGARLPHSMSVHVFHGLDDETVPPSHAGLYGRAIPQAKVHPLAGRDHQINGDLTEVAKAICN